MDVTGVIVDISDQESIKLKSGTQKVRKYITIIDETCCSVTIVSDSLSLMIS